MERDDPTDVDFVHKEGQKGKGKGNDKGKRKHKSKSKGKGKQNEKRKSSGKSKSNQEQFQGTCRNCGKTRHKWSECWAKGGGAAKQANNVGETEKNGDVNWIMMVQDLSVGQSSTSEIETWRCSGTSVSCKKRTRITSVNPCRVRSRCSQSQCCTPCCRIKFDTAEHS